MSRGSCSRLARAFTLSSPPPSRCLRSPVAMDFDEDCRLYVAEFPEYNQYADSKPHGTGCIRRLEDVDGDGIYDKSTLFAENVPTATAVICWNGGVYAGSARFDLSQRY